MKQTDKEKKQEVKAQKHQDKELEALKKSLGKVQKEKDELFTKLQRVSADYANYQKRAPKQITDSIVYEKEKIIKTLLPVLDNFEHTLANVHSAENLAVVIKGVEIVYDQMLDILKQHNVEQIKAVDEVFNPAMHEAMMQRSEPDKEDGVVLEEFQKGYKLNGRVIRPSKVIVNKIEAEQEGEEQQQQKDSQ